MPLRPGSNLPLVMWLHNNDSLIQLIQSCRFAKKVKNLIFGPDFPLLILWLICRWSWIFHDSSQEAEIAARLVRLHLLDGFHQHSFNKPGVDSPPAEQFDGLLAQISIFKTIPLGTLLGSGSINNVAQNLKNMAGCPMLLKVVIWSYFSVIICSPVILNAGVLQWLQERGRLGRGDVGEGWNRCRFRLLPKYWQLLCLSNSSVMFHLNATQVAGGGGGLHSI